MARIRHPVRCRATVSIGLSDTMLFNSAADYLLPRPRRTFDTWSGAEISPNIEICPALSILLEASIRVERIHPLSGMSNNLCITRAVISVGCALMFSRLKMISSPDGSQYESVEAVFTH